MKGGRAMRTVRLAVILAVLTLPASAQTLPGQEAPESPSLFEQGARMMLRGFLNEMQPALDDMGESLQKIEPALRDMARLVDDIRNYEAPRMLPNGDILIPRRPGAPPPPVFPDGTGPGDAPGPGEVDL